MQVGAVSYKLSASIVSQTGVYGSRDPYAKQSLSSKQPRGDEKMVRLLMNAGADSDQVCGRFGETPRSIVSDKGHTKLLHLF